MEKVIITVLGKDSVGIIARVCTYFSENSINILDISQTIVDGYFNMMMITDCSVTKKTMAEMHEDLDKIGEQLGVNIRAQRAEIFDAMHRI